MADRASVKHAPRDDARYKYRIGTSMVPSAEYSVVFDDFIFAIGKTMDRDANATFEWEPNVPEGIWDAAIIDSGGTVSHSTTAATGANGVLLFADATASEGAAIYGKKVIQLTPGKKFWMEARVRTNDVTDNAIRFGLSSLDATTDPEDLWDTSTATGVAFGIVDGSATVTMVYDLANVGPVTDTGSRALTADTWHILAIEYDGSKMRGYVDGKLAVTASTAAQIPVSVAVAPFIGHINGNGAGGAVVMVDYVRWVSER